MTFDLQEAIAIAGRWKAAGRVTVQQTPPDAPKYDKEAYKRHYERKKARNWALGLTVDGNPRRFKSLFEPGASKKPGYRARLWKLQHPIPVKPKWTGLCHKELGHAEYVRLWRKMRKEKSNNLSKSV